MNETTKIMAKANETVAHSNREQLNVAQKVATGEMTKDKALGILDELEKKDVELIAEIDRELEKIDKPLESVSGDWTLCLLFIPLALYGFYVAWVVITSMR